MSYYIIIRSPLGCGKSTISKELSKLINAKHISMDIIVDNPKLITREKEDGFISQNNFIQANEIACKDAILNLEEGTPVIFDGNFYWKSQIEDLISRLDFPHYIFTLKIPLKDCIQRDGERNKSYGEMATKVVYKKSTEFDYGILIDVTKPLKDCLDEIISYLPKN